MNNNEIFEQFWKDYQWPEVKAVTWRLYYDDTGAPIEYSMEERSGNYINITPEQYARGNFHVRVIDGKIVELIKNRNHKKLVPDEYGTPCHLNDITIVVDDSQPHVKWKLK